MAWPGETKTYTPNGTGGSGIPAESQHEDISSIDKLIIDYIDGAGGSGGSGGTGGNGGRVENVTVDVSAENDLYIWVAEEMVGESPGRYNGGVAGAADLHGGGSTEVSLIDTNADDSPDEPFLAAAGGGGSEGGEFESGEDGARGGSADGTAPPAGGDGGSTGFGDGGDGEGAIDDQNRSIVSGGSTTTGGGSAENTDGEVQITYTATRNPLSDGSPVTAAYFNAVANALNGVGIIDGCDATPGTGNFEVDISSGNIALGRSKVSVSSDTVTHDSPDAEDRWDLITADSTGSVSITKGTAASTSGEPNAPDIPSGEVLIAPVYIRSGASEILAGDIESDFNAIVETLMGDVLKAGGAVYNAVYADEASIPAEHEVEGAVVYLQDQDGLFVWVSGTGWSAV